MFRVLLNVRQFPYQYYAVYIILYIKTNYSDVYKFEKYKQTYARGQTIVTLFREKESPTETERGAFDCGRP
jgi:hypothetical protein